MKIINQKPTKKIKKQNFIFDRTKTANKKGNHLLNMIIFFLLISLFILIYFFITWITNYDKTATLDYYIAPATATISLNQEILKPEGKIKLKPGTYNITVKKPGFNDYSTTLELKHNQTTYFYNTLEPTSDNLNYYQTHPDDASRVQHVADTQADLERKNYTDGDLFLTLHPTPVTKMVFLLLPKNKIILQKFFSKSIY